MNDLLRKIQNQKATVGIIGLGYVGLPLLIRFGEAGFALIGFDVDSTKINALLHGRSYIRHIPIEPVQRFLEAGQLDVTVSFERLKEADCIIICVPTPLTDKMEPDLRFIESTTKTIASHLRPGQLVVLESTTYPGTTEELVLPELEKTGLHVGQDFFLAFSPEREDPGNPNYHTGNIPKVVGGVTAQCLECAQALYAHAVTRVVPVSSTRVAELTKLLENIYRSVNIALVNELKVLALRMGIDIWEVIEAASTKPFGFTPFYPGPGLGGHCIPIDPFYLSWKAREYDFPTRFIQLAGEVNVSMPYYVLERIMEALNEHGKCLKGAKILVLGVAYKKDIDDDRESPSYAIMELLEQRGATLHYNDPHIPKLKPGRKHAFQLESTELSEEALAAMDAVVILTDHSAYDYAWIVQHAPLVIDTRNATKGVQEGREKIVKA
ncbi:UDP-N-acetyl-D-glucosamine dehydrogenase [Desulfacinum hydrothermale DSM 13146]|uniref:UDP-N-acetyl-D-glucosamine dehydrogenase n=1 Tax=Desulfacinum hydrothermale DSM 13146 TaxID=1121390 RepID=A0A1W1XTH5_9BACT|nr:nucleotide sugar dehydrogenase [Desulfacinum hydrothermale]SMC27152.1 UDP-N-acetyl-D-glucosamine dehydrogenase [Desulfacinum hydrothermale DSM 13146]